MNVQKLVEKDADFKAFPKRARVRIGLERLEQYPSILVVAWIENIRQDLLNALLRADLYALVAIGYDMSARPSILKLNRDLKADGENLDLFLALESGRIKQ